MKGYGNFNAGEFYGGSQIRMSPEKAVTSSAAVIEALTIASGELVLRAGLQVTARIYGRAPDIDLGYGSGADIFMDGLGTLATQRVIWAPHGRGVIATNQTPLVEVEGLYFTGNDTIDITMNSSAITRGSVRVIAEVIDITEMD